MTEQDEEKLNRALEIYKKTGDVLQTLNNEDDKIKEQFQEEQLPDKKETKKIKKRIRSIWNDYRNNALDQISLENYKKYCELQVIKAESDKKLAEIKRDKEKEEAQHWLEMHKGNLKEIGYNTESVPNKYFYAIDRYIFYIKNRCKNIPKLTWYILVGILGIGVVILMAIGLSKIV